LHNDDGKPIPFHLAQNMVWDSTRRTVAMIAGSQGGKTTFFPWWLKREIYDLRGGGDYLAVTASFDLFKLKMLPAMLLVFEQILGLGRYWTGDKVIELRNPVTGEFQAKRSVDPMWGRIILRSADALYGLESSTAKAACLDEAGQTRFTFQAYKAIKRRIALNRGRLLITTTLYDLGWLVNNIIDPCLEDGKVDYYTIGKAEIERTDSEKHNTTVVQFDSIVNPVFPQSEFDEAKELLPDDEFQMYYRGRKATRRFLIYDNFNSINHTCAPFEIPSHWKRYMGLDFGGANTCAVFYAEDPEKRLLYAYREYLSGGRSIKEHATELLTREVGVPFCVGGAASEGQWRAEFGWHGLPVYQPAIGDVDLGINRVYAQHQVDGIIYFKTLNGIIDQKGRYRRKRNEKGEALDDILDKDTFHFLDSERYLISTIRPGIALRAKIVRLGL